MGDQDQRELREALKTVAVALKETGIPFALIGGYGVWARGGPEPNHDADFLVAREDAAQVAQELADRGLQVVQPPEDWLFKVFVDDVMVDVIFGPSSTWANRAVVERATPMVVLAVEMPVLPAADLVVHKLNALSEHYCDFGAVIPVARALREQLDWEVVRRETTDNPFAVSFLFLLERLGIVEPASDPLESHAALVRNGADDGVARP